jgi:predicted phosphodiesterase
MTQRVHPNLLRSYILKDLNSDRNESMRLAVISDIHANLDALEQVMMDIRRSKVDHVICLGDNIGYGPDPDPVVTMINDLNIPSVIGNHELAVTDQAYLTWFNRSARRSLLLTREWLSDKTIKFISELKPSLTLFDCRFVHGFPPDSATIYLFQVSAEKLQRTFKQIKERICFVGHTHRLEIIEFNGDIITRIPLAKNIINLNGNHRYIINAGSVGQPRDGNNHAKYIIWDSEKDHIEVKYISYDIASVFDKIIEAGLPKEHAIRLL